MLKKFSFLLVFLTATHLHASLQFEIEKGGFDPEDEKITLKQDDAALGFLLYRRELPKVAYIHSFYIKPEWRDNGHEQSLLDYALTHIKNKGYATIVIRAIPFELNDGVLMLIDDPARKEQLVRFYQKNGFRKFLFRQTMLYHGLSLPLFLPLAEGALTGACYGFFISAILREMTYRMRNRKMPHSGLGVITIIFDRKQQEAQPCA